MSARMKPNFPSRPGMIRILLLQTDKKQEKKINLNVKVKDYAGIPCGVCT